MKTFATLVLALVLATTANAQSVKPRGFATPATTTTTTTTTTADNTTATETPAAPETQERAMTSDQKLDVIMQQTEGSAQGSDLRKLAGSITEDWRSNIATNREWMDKISKTQIRLDKKLKWVFWMVILAIFFLAVLVALMVIFHIKNMRMENHQNRDNPTGTIIAPLIFFTLLSMGLASHAEATTPSECTIRSISSGSVIVKEQDPAEMKIFVRNCTDVKSVTAATTGVTFTDVTQKGNIVTAKVTADVTTLTGPTSFKLTLADGNETVSPDAVYLLVLDPATAVVRKDATVAISKVSKKVVVLESRIENVSVSRPTRDELMASISPLQGRIADLEKVVVSLQGEVETANNRVAALAVATTTLADGQVALGQTEVKKTFWGGKKPLNPKVAGAAEQIRDAFAPPPSVVNAMDR